MRIISTGVLAFGFTLCVTLNRYGQMQSSPNAPGYKKVMRPRSSLWRSDQCEVSTLPTDEYCYFLRFYSDGTVIGVNATGNPRQIKKWFRRPYRNSGKYAITGNEIRFSLTSLEGTVDYEGTINGKLILIKFYSHINENRESLTYVWVQPQRKSNRRLPPR